MGALPTGTAEESEYNRFVDSPLTLTALLAAYGAVLSSIGFGWNLYRDLQNKPHLKFDMHIRSIVKSPDGKWYQVSPDLPIKGASEQLFLVVNVTNVGRRPVKWTGWGGQYHKRHQGKSGFTIQPTSIPIMLPEGESFSELTGDLSAVSDDVKRLFIWDATGKYWHPSSRALRKLKEERRKFVAEPEEQKAEKAAEPDAKW